MQGTMRYTNAVMNKKRLTQRLTGAGRQINTRCVGNLGFVHVDTSMIERSLAADINTHRDAASTKFMFISIMNFIPLLMVA